MFIDLSDFKTRIFTINMGAMLVGFSSLVSMGRPYPILSLVAIITNAFMFFVFAALLLARTKALRRRGEM
jgi:hypothetical protein